MKKSKASAGSTKRASQMTKEELIATLVKKKQCNAKALSIVELMLEREVNTQWLLDSLKFISQSHYQDAVEERAIMKICGYPLCQNSLGNIPKKQYHISTQNNKVYDISDRKNFCTNACYRSSSFLKDQILTSPLWLRDIDKAPEYKLLDSGTVRGGFGDEIDVGPTRVPLKEALISHDNSRKTENISLGDDNKNPCTNSSESSFDISGNNNLEESFAPQKNEHDLLMDEGKKTASIPNAMSDNDKLPCTSRSLETILDKPNKILLKMDRDEDTIKLSESNVQVEPCSVTNVSKEPSRTDILIDTDKTMTLSENRVQVERCSVTNVSEEPSSADILKTTVKTLANDSRKQESVTETTVSDSSKPKSSVVLVGNEKEPCNSKMTEDSCEKITAKETEDSTQMMERDKHKAKVRKEKRTSKRSQVSPVVMPCIFEMVEERLKEWFTVDSLCFLYNEQRVKEMLGHLGGDLELDFKPLNSATWDPEKFDRFVNMCKRLDLQDLVDRSFDEKVINEDKNIVKKPLPDFNKLKEEAKTMELRVQAFYSCRPSFDLELEPKKVTFAEDTKEDVEDRVLPVIPLVHQHEQRALRRRLVLDALNRVLPDLLRTIGVNASQVNSPLRGLIGTFALSASNITFNPRQLTLLAIAIIKLLSLKEASLKRALASEASQKYLTLIQMSYNLSPTFLDLLIDRLVSTIPVKSA